MRNVQSDNKLDKFCVSKPSQNAARADAYMPQSGKDSSPQKSPWESAKVTKGQKKITVPHAEWAFPSSV